jgi:membrane protein required for colicin V production
MPPWVFDVIVIGLTILSAVMSIGRGLIREAFSVVSFVVGGIAALLCLQLFRAPLASLITPDDPNSTIPAAILVVIGFLVAYVLAAFVGGRLAKLIHTSPEIGALDRLAGAGFGVARGILAAILFVLLMHQVVPRGEEPPEIAKSTTYPYLDGAAGAVGGGLTWVIELFTGPPKPAAKPTPASQ